MSPLRRTTLRHDAREPLVSSILLANPGRILAATPLASALDCHRMPLKRCHRWARQALAACFAVALLLAPAAQSQTPSRIVAIADVHGAYPQFVALLQSARLIDTKLKWIGGSAVLVQTGDVIDRGAQSRECLDLLMALEKEAPKKGGAVIPLLGNHEVMNVVGLLGYVTPEIYKSFAKGDAEKKRQQAYKDYLKFLAAHDGHGHSPIPSIPPIPPGPPGDDAARVKWMDEHPPGFVEHRDAFGPKGKYGKWIRTHHAVVQVGDGVFLHGGLSPTFEIPSIRQLDERVMAELAAFDSIWKTLVDGKVIWRYMTFSEAEKFAGEEAAWLRTAGAAEPPWTSPCSDCSPPTSGWRPSRPPLVRLSRPEGRSLTVDDDAGAPSGAV